MVINVLLPRRWPWIAAQVDNSRVTSLPLLTFAAALEQLVLQVESAKVVRVALQKRNYPAVACLVASFRTRLAHAADSKAATLPPVSGEVEALNAAINGTRVGGHELAATRSDGEQHDQRRKPP
jgi:hypothetical protein